MKFCLYASFIILIFGCSKDKFISIPESEFDAIVIIDGLETKKSIEGSVEYNEIGILFYSYEDGYYYPLGFNHLPLVSGTFRIHTGFNIKCWSAYYQKCCYSEPDQTIKSYFVYEPDSLSNFIQIELDTNAQEVTGRFNGTYINQENNNDLIEIKCDTFYCKYKKY